MKVGGEWKIVYICRDHLGSITHGLDRYTYAPNTPLVYVDERRELLLIDGLIAALVGGESLEEALKAGGTGALMGFGAGAVTGVATGFKYARDNNVDWRTGKPSASDTDFTEVTSEDLGLRSTLDRINRGERYSHRNDGSVFHNNPLRGTDVRLLPEKPDGYYKEYVHPTPGLRGPGPQRIVIGRNGEIYYTPDHYQTFIKIKY